MGCYELNQNNTNDCNNVKPGILCDCSGENPECISRGFYGYSHPVSGNTGGPADDFLFHVTE